MSKASLTTIACALLLCAGTAQATLNAQQPAQLTCERQKLDAEGILEQCLKQNSALILAGQPGRSATCQSDFTEALAVADKAAAKARASCRYLDNGDGTVSDLNTGLMWEQTTGTVGGTNTGNVNDVNNTYTWSTGATLPDGITLADDGTAFTMFLTALNNGAAPYNGGSPSPITGCFAGRCDWRLPSIVELQGIIDPSGPGCATQSGPGPCIDPIFGPTQASDWSATTGAGGPDGAWFVTFDFGHVGSGGKIGSLYVRAVRSGL